METTNASHQIIADLLALHTGQQLAESRRWRIQSSLAGLFREHGISNVDQLVCLLDQPPLGVASRELEQQVVEALLNNETYFFRDKPTFDQLPLLILPDLARKRAHTKRLTIWSAGCSSGQEAYSLAMMFVEQRSTWDGWTIDILGSDISHKAIKTARSGRYSQFEIQRGLSVTQMLRHFDETAHGWQIREDARRLVRFRQHNILTEPPLNQQCDLILCRNVLLYFDRDARNLTFDRLAGTLAHDGYLMLGAGETVVGHTDRFLAANGLISLFQPNAQTRLARFG
jgi:chemotaxis protein methyltransferase CheR